MSFLSKSIHRIRLWLTPLYWHVRNKGGAIEGEHDPRNAAYPFEKLQQQLEEGGGVPRVILDPSRIDAVYSQSGNMCGGCMGATLLYALTKPLKPNWADRHSPMYLWWWARFYRGLQGLNKGVSANNVLKALTDNGACDNSQWPNYSDYTVAPNASQTATALKNQATAYYWLYSSQATFLDQIVTALSNGMPVGILASLTTEWVSPVKVADGAEVKSKTAFSTYLFGHFVSIVGIDLTRKNLDGTTGSLLIKNSWGTGWGANGLAWISIANWRSAISAAFVVTNREPV